MSNLNNLFQYLILFFIGGLIYVFIEIIYRGYSHISMFIVGGICFVLISSINNFTPFKISLLGQMIIACLLITFIEFISGLIVNIFLNLNVWNYSSEKFNILGQVCLKASIAWFFLSLPAIYLGNFIKSFFN